MDIVRSSDSSKGAMYHFDADLTQDEIISEIGRCEWGEAIFVYRLESNPDTCMPDYALYYDERKRVYTRRNFIHW